ncbi:Cysteine desulfurase CsdA [Thalassoglobus neptunius]|uniref:Cysteine desulfurase CsdA n=1 Tax=Thalassoglobus neptunius TaxID=1938619 RepID=A0A5C5X549_9PLAN|nr:aminotransferase class V-fold PLP-dependent enzyme [Thalassoglobus neptunius]TWT57858.1 Cysteine desulfurase CsdA [Thalassoglobus neptunius]
MTSVYLNHAGTSWPKPETVQKAVQNALQESPEDWGARFEHGHKRVAEFFGIENPDDLLLTPGCTSALSLALFDQPLQPEDEVLTSGFEHHAMERPLIKLGEMGIVTRVIPPTQDRLVDLEMLETSLTSGRVRLMAMTAACNVTGDLLPWNEVGELCHRHEVPFLLDAAQVAGWIDLDFSRSQVDFVAFAAHKGLQSPWGIGGLYCSPQAKMHCQSASCSIVPSPNSESPKRPSYCDTGSVDRIALEGLAAATEWLNQEEASVRLSKARAQIGRFEEVLKADSRVKLVSREPLQARLPTVAFIVDGISPGDLADSLEQRSLIVSAGFQCAPSAHETLGTSEQGVLRLSLGPLTSDAEINFTCEALQSALSAI